MPVAVLAKNKVSSHLLNTHYNEKLGLCRTENLTSENYREIYKDDKSYTSGDNNREEQDEETERSIPQHPLDIKPLGNAYMASEDLRIASGYFHRLPEETLVYLLEQLNAPALVALGATCKALYAFTRADELWRTLYIANPPDPFTMKPGHWRGTWRSTYLRLSRSSVSQISCKDLFSDALFRPFHCATLPLHPYISTIPAKNAIPRLENMSAAEYVGVNGSSTGTDGNATAVNVEYGNGPTKNGNSTRGWSDRPFILTDVVSHWPAYQQKQGQKGQEEALSSSALLTSPLPWTMDNLLEHHGGVIFRAEALEWPLRTYVEYMCDNRDESPLYLFDCRFAEKMGMGAVANENKNINKDEVNADTCTNMADTRKRKRKTSSSEYDGRYRRTKFTNTATKIKRTDGYISNNVDDNDEKEEEREEDNSVTNIPTQSPFWPPACFADDLFDVWDVDERPDWRWMIIGPERSGSTFHVDPNGTSAWNAVLSGMKYWILFPPPTSSSPLPPGIHIPPSSSSSSSSSGSTITTPLSIPEYLLTFHRAARQYPSCLEALVHPGEVIHVPAGWLHCVLNVDGEGIALTANFVPDGVERSLKRVLGFMKSGNGDISGFPERKRRRKNNNNDNNNSNNDNDNSVKDGVGGGIDANVNGEGGIDDDDDDNANNMYFYNTFIARLRQKRPAVIPMLDRVLAELEREREREQEQERERDRIRQSGMRGRMTRRRTEKAKAKAKAKQEGEGEGEGEGKGEKNGTGRWWCNHSTIDGNGHGKSRGEEEEEEIEKENESFLFNFSF